VLIVLHQYNVRRREKPHKEMNYPVQLQRFGLEIGSAPASAVANDALVVGIPTRETESNGSSAR
jgi:hypothetical protein